MGGIEEGLTAGRDAVNAGEAALGSEHPVLAQTYTACAFHLKVLARRDTCYSRPCRFIICCGAFNERDDSSGAWKVLHFLWQPI